MKFNPGQIVSTPGALEVMPFEQMLALLQRHLSGDWGTIDPSDKRLNDEAVKLGNRVLSAYAIDESKPSKGYGDNTIWVITEADRSVTTFLLPDEY